MAPSAPIPLPRPVVHFTPRRGWLNDPNGLAHVGGRFHLYFQHHPHDTTWGPMHWGHASSTDLVTWRHHRIALAPDERGTIYSGSAVVDVDDTAGLGVGALVAAFTHHRDGVEEQSLAWSLDGGETFTKLPTPVLEAPPDTPDFRDPRLLANPAGQPRWVMLLAVGHAVWFYASDDLRTWSRTGVVEEVFGDAGTWETPELLSFTDDRGARVDVLVAAVGDGAPAGGSGVQAVVGTFDGSTFVPAADPFWVDHGPAFYAPQAWHDMTDGRTVWVGWLANWHTVHELPARGWRGQMTIPREVSLHRGAAGRRLVQSPIAELAQHRFPVSTAGASALDVVLDAMPDDSADTTATVRAARADQTLTARVDHGAETLAVELTEPGRPARRWCAPAERVGDHPALRILLDVASAEVFAGTATISLALAAADANWVVDTHDGAGRLRVHGLSREPVSGRPDPTSDRCASD